MGSTSISSFHIKLDFLYNSEPFKNAFFVTRKKNSQQILLNNLGSGYEMIFAFLYSFYLAEQSGKQLIVLIDEPELHLHPTLQEKFVEFLLEFSKKAQIILTSHSPLLVKQLSFNDNVKINVIKDGQEVSEMGERILPYISANETNFLAFSLPTVEFHNELYGCIQEKTQKYTEEDVESYFASKNIKKSREWTPVRHGTAQKEKKVTLQTFIRNKIHHPENTIMQNAEYSPEELKQSIDEMTNLL